MMGREEDGEGKEQLMIQSHHIIFQAWWRHSMALACMAANGTGSLVFVDDVTADNSSRIHSEVYRAILSAQIQPNPSKLIGWYLMVQMGNDSKHTAKATNELLKAKKWDILQWPSQSPDLNPTNNAFHFLRRKSRAERPIINKNGFNS